jgi:hypothetical protein
MELSLLPVFFYDWIVLCPCDCTGKFKDAYTQPLPGKRHHLLNLSGIKFEVIPG